MLTMIVIVMTNTVFLYNNDDDNENNDNDEFVGDDKDDNINDIRITINVKWESKSNKCFQVNSKYADKLTYGKLWTLYPHLCYRMVHCGIFFWCIDTDAFLCCLI